jgi:hypothetical protein
MTGFQPFGAIAARIVASLPQPDLDEDLPDTPGDELPAEEDEEEFA